MRGWAGPGCQRLGLKRAAAASRACGSEAITGRENSAAAGVACDSGKRERGIFAYQPVKKLHLPFLLVTGPGPALLSDVEHDLAKVPAALLVAECGNDLLQRKMPVDHRPQTIGFDRSYHVLLLSSTAHQ